MIPCFSQPDIENISQFITIDGKTKENKWNIPDILNSEEKRILIKVKKKAHQLDESFCGCFMGLDPLIGLLPIIGDFSGIILSFWLINYIRRTNVIKNNENQMKNEMIVNVIKDLLIGFLPFIGDAFDIIYKSNKINTLVFQRYLIKQAKQRHLIDNNV